MQTATLTEDNRRNQPLAFVISLGIYGAFLAILFFLKLMYTPLEEPEGVELNYGIDLVGSGDIQTTNKANPSPNNYDVKPAAKEEEAKPVKVKPVVTPPPVAEKPVKVKVKEAPAKPVITSNEDSPVTEKENDKPVKKVETKLILKRRLKHQNRSLQDLNHLRELSMMVHYLKRVQKAQMVPMALTLIRMELSETEMV